MTPTDALSEQLLSPDQIDGAELLRRHMRKVSRSEFAGMGGRAHSHVEPKERAPVCDVCGCADFDVRHGKVYCARCHQLLENCCGD